MLLSLRRLALALLGLTLFGHGPVHGGESRPALPRFASLSSGKVFLRQGPSYAYRILWVYHRRGLPVLVTAEYDVWRQIRLPDGTTGWVHTAMLSARRTVVVTGSSPAPVRAGEGPGARVRALAAPGVVGTLDRCDGKACAVRLTGTDGWIDQNRLWGVALGPNGS